MNRYGIFAAQYTDCLLRVYANSEADALDQWAGYRSGYDTFEEMGRSATFRDCMDVTAIEVSP